MIGLEITPVPGSPHPWMEHVDILIHTWLAVGSGMTDTQLSDLLGAFIQANLHTANLLTSKL